MTIQITTDNNSLHVSWAADTAAPKSLITLTTGSPRHDGTERHVLRINTRGSPKATITFTSDELSYLRSQLTSYYRTRAYHQANP